MNTNIQPKQLFLNRFRANLRQVHWATLALTFFLFGFLLPAQGQDPRITNIKYPMDTNVSVGVTVSFRVYASTSTDRITFQWRHDNVDLTGATNNLLILTNLTMADAGAYQAIVWNAIGESTNTRTAALTVDPTFSKVTGQPIVTDREASELGAWCDYDSDGYLDLFVANSMNTTPGVKNSLYHNDRNGSFIRVTNTVTARAANTWGSVWADYDNDGRPDLFMTHWGGTASELFHNLGGGQFAAASTPFLLAGADQIDGAWSDLDGDGWVDLVVSTWANKKDQAFRNLGDGRFQPFTTAEVGALVADSATTGASSFADFDNDGDPDIYVSCESGPAFLYRNQGGGRYEKVQFGSLPGSLSTVGGVWADFNNDGFFDLITTTRDGFCTLHLSVGGQSFQDITTTAGVVMPRGMAWGPAWGDVDNDGDLDLFVPYYSSTNLMFLNNGNGTFSSIDIGSPLREGVNDECALWADYDNDGFLDLFIACGEANPSPNLLYRNNLPATGNTNHWVKIRLSGTASNRSGIGAKIRLRAVVGGKEVWQLRQIASNGAFASGTELVAHFGLGNATKIDTLRIEWPSGNVQELTDVAPDRLLTLTEPTLITPTRTAASLNGSVTLTRTAVAGATYQWQFNGVDLAGQTNRTLNLTNIVADQQGHYSVVASNATTMTTNSVYLHIDTQFTKITTGPIVAGNESAWGCSWADYDGDGDIDLLVGNGVESSGFERMGFYRNDGSAGFVRLTNEVGSLVSELGRFEGGTWADYDNDGHLDCLVTDWTTTKTTLALHRNLGNATFRRETVHPLSDAIPGYVSWVDYDNDGWLDVFDAMAWSAGGIPTNALFHASGSGRFTSVSTGTLVKDRFVGLEAAAWGDYDGDGDQDLIATDPHAWWGNSSAYPNHFYRNDGGGVFTRVTTNVIALDRTSSLVPAWADYDNDGRLDVFITSYGDTSRLFHNDGNGQFTKILMGPGLETGQPAWGDYDNDGDLDLYIVRGQGTATTNLFYRNNGNGTFSTITLGNPASDVARSGSCIWGDYDNDGFLDLFVANNRGGSDCLYHNNGNGNHWLMVKLVGTASNRSAIGAKVRAYAKVQGKFQWQLRDIQGGNRCQNDPRAHFGLETATNVTTLRVEWPSGTVQEFLNVAADQILTLWEPPTLSAAVREDGACELSITAEPNRGWQIQASGDLLTWQTLTTLTSTTATIYYIDTAAAGVDRRFYRVESK